MTTCPVCNEQSTVEAWRKTEEVIYTIPDDQGNPKPYAHWAHCPNCDALCFYGEDISEGGLVEFTEDMSIL